MSTIKVNNIQDVNGIERYTARAWVSFNGQGTVAIKAAGNVSSITDIYTGQYQVNFTAAMPDTNFGVLATASDDELVNTAVSLNSTAPVTTASVKLNCWGGGSSTGGQRDPKIVTATIFR